MRNKKSIIILLLVMLLGTIMQAQNLVPNPSFEEYTLCPVGPDDLDYTVSWYSPNGSSSDYFNSCSPNPNFSVPNNWWGFQNARTGIGYSGIIVYHILMSNYREYARCQLNQPLIASKHYCVEFYVNLGDSSKYTISSIGAYFSIENNISTTGGVLNYQPQVENFDTLFLSDKQNWMKISGCFIAIGGEEYLTIGNFKNDSIIDTLSTTSFGSFEGQYEAYYYIDDVSVIEDTTIGLNNLNKNQILIYPNPCQNNFTINNLTEYEIDTIFLFDTIGNLLKEYSLNHDANSYNVESLQNGFFILKIILKNKSIINYQLIINH
ncbi:MAG: T9SS type A sorting domain-containing protein [bacterium]